jgi:hypothetical protein
VRSEEVYREGAGVVSNEKVRRADGDYPREDSFSGSVLLLVVVSFGKHEQVSTGNTIWRWEWAGVGGRRTLQRELLTSVSNGCQF